MLILSRRPGDAIVIDGGIRIVVLASGQRCVRLGIEAPAQVGIVREEIITRAENAATNGVNGHKAAKKPGEEQTAEEPPEGEPPEGEPSDQPGR
jgi:carbon storage regulator